MVQRRTMLAAGVAGLILSDPVGQALPEWTPGAHIDLVLGDGLVRQYSLCGELADRTQWRIAVQREPASRGGSRRVHDRLGEGSLVRVRGPRNNFPLRPAARYLFIAGGIGITPIRPMVAAADAAGADWLLLYGGRTRAAMAFVDELAQFGQRVLVRPQDEFGLLDLDSVLTDAGARSKRAPDDTLVYCCGPEALLTAVERRCAGWPAGALHTERFTATAADQSGGSFEVVLARSGATLGVPPDMSILDVLEAAGHTVLSSCQEGTCGTCETAVLAGQPDHRDSVLSAEDREAGDVMMICVSRSATPRLVLDL